MPNGLLGMEVCHRVAATSPHVGLLLTSGFPRGALGALPPQVDFPPSPSGSARCWPRSTKPKRGRG